MSILPKNEKQLTIDMPRNFFIYGATMAGKSYLAGKFPEPLYLNTDGNAKANPYPNVQLKNVRDKDGKLVKGVMEQIDELMLELQTMNSGSEYGYKTIIVDVIEDVCTLIEQEICMKQGVETLADIAYGKGYAMFNSVLQTLVMNLKALPVYVVYISREIENTDNNNVVKKEPALKTKYYNIVNGNCDLVIHCQKIGNNYVRSIKDRRKKYYASNIKDEKILRILKAITGSLVPEQKTQPEKEGK